MISKDRVHAGLSEIFTEVFMRDDIVLSDELTARDVAGWDSFKHIEILMAAEEHFAMKFSSAEMDAITQLGDMVAIISLKGTKA